MNFITKQESPLISLPWNATLLPQLSKMVPLSAAQTEEFVPKGINKKQGPQ